MNRAIEKRKVRSPRGLYVWLYKYFSSNSSYRQQPNKVVLQSKSQLHEYPNKIYEAFLWQEHPTEARPGEVYGIRVSHFILLGYILTPIRDHLSS